VNITEIKLSELIPYEKNAKSHPKDQVEKIANSIKRFGFQQPIVIDKENNVIVGHGRLLAAQKLKLETVPCLTAENLTVEEINAYRLADNKLNESEWDMELVLKDLELLPEDLAGLTGFDLSELEPDEIIEDEAPEPPEEPVSKLGDLYQLGEHRLLCGDATKLEDVERLMDGQKADMVFTDPPYGIDAVSKEGKVGGGTKNAPAKIYSAVIGDENTDVAREVYSIITLLEVPVQIIWGGNYFTDFLPPTPCWIVWDKERPEGLTFADGEVAWTNQTTPLKFCRHRWDGYHRASERDQERVHPTQKPAYLAAWCFNNYGNGDDIVLDLFGGSGSTLIACEQTKRKCYMLELDPKYIDVIVQRWENFTGNKAKLLTG
jgi:16S rRNA G966 N2-methylase RsmD